MQPQERLRNIRKRRSWRPFLPSQSCQQVSLWIRQQARRIILHRTNDVITKHLPPKTVNVVFCQPTHFHTRVYTILAEKLLDRGVFNAHSLVEGVPSLSSGGPHTNLCQFCCKLSIYPSIKYFFLTYLFYLMKLSRFYSPYHTHGVGHGQQEVAVVAGGDEYKK